MDAEENDTGVETNPDGVEAETKMLTSTEESLQRQRWRVHVGQVMSYFATMDTMVLESISSSDDDDDNDEGGGNGERSEGYDGVRPASVPVANAHDGVRRSL